MKITTKVQVTLEFTTHTAFSGGATFEQVVREAKQGAVNRLKGILSSAMDRRGIEIVAEPKVAAVMAEIDE